MEKPRRNSSGAGAGLGRRLLREGFDLTEYDRRERSYRVRCSGCQATVIQGVACHERGCPNERR